MSDSPAQVPTQAETLQIMAAITHELSELRKLQVRRTAGKKRRATRARAKLSQEDQEHNDNIAEVDELVNTEEPLRVARILSGINPANSVAAVGGALTESRIAQERERQDLARVNESIATMTVKTARDPDEWAGFLQPCTTDEHRALVVRELLSKVESFIATSLPQPQIGEATTASALNVVFVNLIRSLRNFPGIAGDPSFLLAMNCIQAEHTIALVYNKKTDGCKEAAAQLRRHAQGLGPTEKELRLMKDANEAAKFQRGEKP